MSLLFLPAIPAISSQFNAATDIGWYGAAYPLTMCALQPLSGKISTIFSLRLSYLVFFSIFLLGYLLCGAANGSTMFIIGRAVAGIGGAGVVSGGLSVIALVTPTAQRPLFTGLVTSLYAVGTVIAPLIGGAFTSNVTWRWCFYINLPAGAVAVGTLLFFFHPSQSTDVDQQEAVIQRIMELDLIGCILFVGSIVMVFLALQWGGGEYSWNLATVIGLFVGFGVLMLLFVVWEMRRGEAALIPFTLLRDCSVVLSILFAFLFMGSFVIPVYYLPEWFQIVKDVSPMRSGVMLLPSVCTQVFGAIVSGVTTKYVQYYNPWFFIGSTFLCTASGLYTTFTLSTSSGQWIGFQILQGLGCGFAAQMALLTVQNVLKTKPKIIPIGISTVLFAQYFGSSVMQTVSASIFQNKLVDGLESPAGAGLSATDAMILLEAGNLKHQADRC
ncbi:major facilitator superfamily domain-containing protein [Aspergillus undulatus]|uniref:major facilitator superfamily domain-containing protein n=1 Tax=Aspergillus undulatus TaxID=1810928 RepID=UPI003CCCE14C